MTELEKKKRMLLAESEVYRQLLKLEFHNLKICRLQAKRRFTSFGLTNPLFMLGLPAVGALFMKGSPVAGSLFGRRRRSGWKQFIATVFMSWQAYNRLVPFCKTIFSRDGEAARKAPTHVEEMRPRAKV